MKFPPFCVSPQSEHAARMACDQIVNGIYVDAFGYKYGKVFPDDFGYLWCVQPDYKKETLTEYKNFDRT